jgi:hypothetical protein
MGRHEGGICTGIEKENTTTTDRDLLVKKWERLLRLVCCLLEGLDLYQNVSI